MTEYKMELTDEFIEGEIENAGGRKQVFDFIDKRFELEHIEGNKFEGNDTSLELLQDDNIESVIEEPYITNKWKLPFIDSFGEVDEVMDRERAEDYRGKELLKMTSLNLRLKTELEEFFFEGNKKILIGDRGSGKTFVILKTLYEMKLKLNVSLNILVFAFKRNRKIERIMGKDLPDDKQDAIDVADIVVFDDLHYMLDDVMKGNYHPQVFVNFLSDMIEIALETDTKILLVCDKYLRNYRDVFDDPKYDEVLRQFGYQADPDVIEKDVSYLDNLEMPKPFKLSWKAFSNDLGVNLPETILYLLYENDVGPRAISRFRKKFGKNLTQKSLVEYIVNEIEKLNLGKKGEYYKFLTKELPFVSCDFSNVDDSVWHFTEDDIKNGERISNVYRKKIDFFEKCIDDIVNIVKERNEINKSDMNEFEVFRKYINGPFMNERILRENALEYIDSISSSTRFFNSWSNKQNYYELIRFVEHKNEYEKFLKFLNRTESILSEQNMNVEEIKKEYRIALVNAGGNMIPREIYEVVLHYEIFGEELKKECIPDYLTILKNFYCKSKKED